MNHEHSHIGGQAVIEGVMMRDKNYYSIAVRLPNGNIETLLKELKVWPKIFQFPFLRGIKALIENLKIGYSSLEWSAQKNDIENAEKPSDIWTFFTVLFSIAVAIGLFIVLPNLVVHFLGLVENESPFLFNLASGGVRLLIFTGYVLSISLIKDIKRIFQYHGAEHKVIHAFEKKLELSLENIKQFTTLHKRCGTSFLFLLIFVSILLFSIVPVILLQWPFFASATLLVQKVLIFLSHILLLPLLAALSYEILRLSAQNNILGKILSFFAYPGLFFQKITTKEPDEKQIEVALASLKILLEKKETGQQNTISQ